VIYDGPLAPFDTETTSQYPHEARIVTAFLGLVDGDSLLVSHRWLVNPGVEIPETAVEIHGITNEHARDHGMDPATAILEIEAQLLAITVQGIPVVVMNAPYDFTVVDSEIVRHHDGRPLAFTPFPVIDPYVLDKALDPYRKGKRTLADLADHYGLPFTGAHDAEADALMAAALVRVLLPLIEEQARGNGWTADIDLETLHAWQKSWRRKQTLSLLDYYRRREAAEEASNPYANITGESAYRDEDFPPTWPIHDRKATT
jgi:DNA polymerase-3 subunit epsilon